jgi:hypothetical protein
MFTVGILLDLLTEETEHLKDHMEKKVNPLNILEVD